ncbi:dTDP-4-dehydrorhamnose 3,5-epimerase family protein [Verrucomicrobium spinosum]|uniref:dTDP-4-dehydrorhamnose 3,5-epimerase family protein n=1 Tax=Verrucomicrobium spinosum TaxID=2736 RepID=UPI0001745329|nr:dTDP-4-dehydrorhamnose 3,5-epimerase family protein [Verrucomicrobium spinosum]
MIFTPSTIPEVMIVEPEPHHDARGFLARTYCEGEFACRGLNTRWPQQNHTLTKGRGSVRGLHWQADPASEIKLVRCLAGCALDVVVDVRPDSPTFGTWELHELSAASRRAIYIPAGFAHGFQCLTDECELFYLMSERHAPALARGLNASDPTLAIPWPLPVVNRSERDVNLPLWSDFAKPAVG